MTTSHKRLTFKVPNRLITDPTLTYTARRLGAVLYAHRSALGMCRKSQATLAALAGCAVSTLREALALLEKSGYISIQHCYRHCQKLGRLIRTRSVYCCDLSFRGGYTLLPREVLAQRDALAPSSFTVLMYLYQQAGNKSRAYPSIKRIQEALDMGRSSVCRALQEIRRLSCILVQHCVKKNRAHASNSYHVAVIVRPRQAHSVDAHKKAPVCPKRIEKPRSDVALKVLSCSFSYCYHTARGLRCPPLFASRGSPKISKHRLRLR